MSVPAVLGVLTMILALLLLLLIASMRKDYVRQLASSLEGQQSRELSILREADLLRTHAQAAQELATRPRTTAPPDCPLTLTVELSKKEQSEKDISQFRTRASKNPDQFIEVLIDPSQPFIARRRIPRFLLECPGPRVAEALLRGLTDKRFAVRFQCGAALFFAAGRTPIGSVAKNCLLS